MTEEEARSKWCHKYQVASSGGDMSTFEHDNRPLEYVEIEKGKWQLSGRLSPGCCCIGSACMAWRWEGMYVPAEGEPYRTGGYCGLVGRS